MLPEDFPDIPEWVKWLAQDENGTWWGYSVEPLQQHRGWYENEVGDVIKLKNAAPNPDWRNTLSPVPKEW